MDYYAPIGGLTVITAPTFEPVTLTEMKTHLRYDYDNENTLIETLIRAAREWVENYTGRALVEQTLEYAIDSYPDEMRLPRPPIIEVESFKYTDSAGTSTLLAANQYTLDTSAPLLPRIVPAYNVSWPGTRSQPSSLRIRYKAGYAREGSPDDHAAVPASLRAAIKLLVGHWFKNRESVVIGVAANEVPMAAMALCDPYRAHFGF